MAKINRFNGNLKAFAADALGTERTVFGELTQANDLDSQFTADFFRGWGIVGPSDQPSLQDFNAMGYTLGQVLAYLHQMGVPEYNAAQEFYLNSVTMSGGVAYVSLQNANTGNTPASNPAWWRELYPQSTLTVRGTALRASTAQATAGLDDISMMTPLKVKQAIDAFPSTPSAASETVAGIAELATQAETETGTNDSTIVTPLKLRGRQQINKTDPTAGKLMINGAYGLGDATLVTNLNAAPAGFFYAAGSATNSPAPAVPIIQGVTLSSTGSASKIQWCSSSADGALYSRSFDGTSWSTWIAVSQPNKAKCMAWVNFNGTGTVAIRDSYNISSITDGGVGLYTANFTTNMLNANYSTTITLSTSGSTAPAPGVSSQSASSVSMRSAGGGGAAADFDQISIVIIGGV